MRIRCLCQQAYIVQHRTHPTSQHRLLPFDIRQTHTTTAYHKVGHAMPCHPSVHKEDTASSSQTTRTSTMSTAPRRRPQKARRRARICISVPHISNALRSAYLPTFRFPITNELGEACSLVSLRWVSLPGNKALVAHPAPKPPLPVLCTAHTHAFTLASSKTPGFVGTPSSRPCSSPRLLSTDLRFAKQGRSLAKGRIVHPTAVPPLPMLNADRHLPGAITGDVSLQPSVDPPELASRRLLSPHTLDRQLAVSALSRLLS